MIAERIVVNDDTKITIILVLLLAITVMVMITEKLITLTDNYNHTSRMIFM